MIFLTGLAAQEYTQLLADLREGRLVRVSAPPVAGTVHGGTYVPTSTVSYDAALAATATIAADDWAAVNDAIREMQRPQIETNAMLATARRQLQAGVSRKGVIDYALDGRL